MITTDHITILPFNESVKRIIYVSVSRPLLPAAKEVKKITEVSTHKKEFPLDKWNMPPEPHCYIKCKKHD